LGWMVGVIRKHVMRMRGIEYGDGDMERALHRMLTESMLVIGITEGDDEQFTSTFSVLVWPQRVKKELQIKCRWDEPVVLSVLADGEVISMEDAIVMLSVHRVYSIHTKVHAMANWAFLGENAFPGRSESVLYNYFGTVTFKKLCGFWSYFSGFDHRDYFELLVQDSMNEHFKHPLTFLSFKHKSRIIHFLAEAREAVIDIFRPLGMTRRQMEGIYGVTVLHSLDHYTMGTSLDPMILVDSTTTLPEMCDFVTFTECGFVHETPLLLGSYRLSTLKENCFQSLSKRLIAIDDELGNQVDFAIVQ